MRSLKWCRWSSRTGSGLRVSEKWNSWRQEAVWRRTLPARTTFYQHKHNRTFSTIKILEVTNFINMLTSQHIPSGVNQPSLIHRLRWSGPEFWAGRSSVFIQAGAVTNDITSTNSNRRRINMRNKPDRWGGTHEDALSMLRREGLWTLKTVSTTNGSMWGWWSLHTLCLYLKHVQLV